MKHAYFLLLIAMMLFSSCDWRQTPNIVDFGKIELDSKSNYVCLVNGEVVAVDSVLQADKTQKVYKSPYLGQEVTCFAFKSGDLHFFDGKATSAEIKKVYFTSKYENFVVFTIYCFIWLLLCYCIERRRRRKRGRNAKVTTNY